jgi:hypothetical protein
VNHTDWASTQSAQWRKSSRSAQASTCVEVAHLSRMIAVRDPKNPTAPALTFNPHGWNDFCHAINAGKFDR